MNLAKLIKSLCLFVICILVACKSGLHDFNLSEKDLLEYGIPITIQVPDSAKIKAMDWGIQKDVSISGIPGYSLQIFSSKASTHDLTLAIKDLKQTVEDGVYFSKFVMEEPDGFIFEMMIDTLINYDFRHLKIQGDNEYLFQAGMSDSFTQKEVEKLYQISKSAK
jgi:hypothetical protein